MSLPTLQAVFNADQLVAIEAYINNKIALLGQNSAVNVYADNAAAISGGLVVGDFYRTGDAVKIVHT